MDHEEIKSNVFALYDGELSERERREVSAHLHSCRECEALLSSWKKTAALFFQDPPVFSEVDLVPPVMARLPRLEPAEPVNADPLNDARRGWWFPFFTAAALAGFFVMMVSPPDPVDLSAEDSYPLMDSMLIGQKFEPLPSEWLASEDAPQEAQLLAYVVGDL